MRKVLPVCLVFLLVVFLVPAFYAAGNDSYGSYDYYIRSFNVDVTVNNDRSYDVIETITVFFNIESRGIIRDIQTLSSVERYRVENIQVIGDPVEITEYGDYISVRIGDSDIYFTGEKTYTISYTRFHYDDGQPDFDYFYMDLIGDLTDVPIAEFSAVVRLPEAAVINKFTLTSGSRGSTGNEFAKGSESDNIIYVWMRKPLEPFMAVTLNVEMQQGAFPNAVAYTPPIVFHSINVRAELDKYGVLSITEDYDATVNKAARIRHPVSGTAGATALLWMEPGSRLKPAANFYLDFLEDYVGERVNFSCTYQIK